MKLNPDNALATLIRERLADLAWTQADLVGELALRGVSVTPSAVCHWLRGAGVAERHRPGLAHALGVPLLELQSAALDRACE